MKEDLFIDSGAWSMFREALAKHPEVADRFYNLKPGSEFRRYCDRYARFVRKHQSEIRWFVGVDVIGKPEMTRSVQLYFEQEHGLKLIPVVHYGSSLSYLDWYLERDYKMVGLAGFAAFKPSKGEMIRWLDEAFSRICPASNNHLPITRPHGFAMTSIPIMWRYPWFSVDSTRCRVIGAFGTIAVPRLRKGEFCFRQTPIWFGISSKGCKGDYRQRIHISNCVPAVRENVKRWVKHIGADLAELKESVDARHSANIRYFMELAASFPKWPWAWSIGARKSEFGFGI